MAANEFLAVLEALPEMTADAFRAALDALDMKNIEFSRLTGFDKQTVSRWCTGRLAVPKHVALIVVLLQERKLAWRPTRRAA